MNIWYMDIYGKYEYRCEKTLRLDHDNDINQATRN